MLLSRKKQKNRERVKLIQMGVNPNNVLVRESNVLSERQYNLVTGRGYFFKYIPSEKEETQKY